MCDNPMGVAQLSSPKKFRCKTKFRINHIGGGKFCLGESGGVVSPERGSKLKIEHKSDISNIEKDSNLKSIINKFGGTLNDHLDNSHCTTNCSIGVNQNE